ncbi:MAG: hypothetical protein Ct9H90mP22_4550 [Gammaproteobacteria bacterium]|nr:MAG: hypothetical protein Ct9H90mP22_4550 [Gammaproteobacteria bacterium]
MDWEDFVTVVNVHLLGFSFWHNCFFPNMKEQEYGRIIMTSSSSVFLVNFFPKNYGAGPRWEWLD